MSAHPLISWQWVEGDGCGGVGSVIGAAAAEGM